MSILNKSILITGSSDGIGKSLAIEFSKLGANIILLGRNSEKLDAVYDLLDHSHVSQKHLILEADLALLSNEAAQEIFIAISQEFEVLDGIIHNAALLGTMSSLEDYDLSTWDEVMKVNLRAPFILTKTLKVMLENASLPRLIFTSSGVANKGISFWGAYSVSKFGIKGLAEIFKDELEATTKIKVFNFDPGKTRTNMRAAAYPAEDPNTLKSPTELIDCYLWFFQEESSSSSQNYFEFSELARQLNST
ncbi:SDR family NAD(P)-dependent oxidoreductase [Pseudomonadota bacterium]|nr:SDR family NAD(P)-dependent oxidoreductase [Pseudomonadota bacterium]